MKRNTLACITACIALLLTCFLTSCDPGYDENGIVINRSSHTLTIIPTDYFFYDSYWDSNYHQIHNTSYTLSPGEEVQVFYTGGIGYASLEEGKRLMNMYLGDSVIFRFEDSLQVVFHTDDTSSASPYNFNSTHYTYEEKSKGRGSYPFFGRLSFTVTDDHHAMAR